MVTGILVQKSGSYWVANANKHFSVSASSAHRVVEMLKAISEKESLVFPNE